MTFNGNIDTEWHEKSDGCWGYVMRIGLKPKRRNTTLTLYYHTMTCREGRRRCSVTGVSLTNGVHLIVPDVWSRKERGVSCPYFGNGLMVVVSWKCTGCDRRGTFTRETVAIASITVGKWVHKFGLGTLVRHCKWTVLKTWDEKRKRRQNRNDIVDEEP